MNTSRIRTALTLIGVLTAMQGNTLFAAGHNALGNIAFAQDEARLIGDWTGDSICQVKDSPCHDEKVVYHIAKGNDQDHVKVSADRIVDGKALNMGALDFTYNRSDSTLLNETAGRVWKFTINGNTMEGTLTRSDKTVYRRVTLKKKE